MPSKGAVIEDHTSGAGTAPGGAGRPAGRAPRPGRAAEWARRLGVAALLLAPVVVVLVVAWPPSPEAVADSADETIAAGDELDGVLGPRGRVTYRFAGTGGPVTVGVRGQGIDPTLTALEQSGRRIAFNDDTNGLDPELVVETAPDEVVVFVVEELSGRPGFFTIYAEAGGVTVGEEVDGGDLAVGARVSGELGREGTVRYRVTGTGEELTITARGEGRDTDLTLRLVDPATGDELRYVDDADGSLDPRVTLTLDAGQVVEVQIREFAGRAGGFTIVVEAGAASPGGGPLGTDGAPADRPGADAGRGEGPAGTTIVVDEG